MKPSPFKVLLTNQYALLFNILLVYIAYNICRIVFFLEYYDYYASNLSYSLVRNLLKGGLLFDTSAIVYFNLLYILLMILPLHNRASRYYQATAKWIFMLTNSLGVVMNLMDVVYFQYTNRRTTASVFQEFANEGNILSIIGKELINHWYLTLIGIALILALFFLYKKPIPSKKEHLNPWFYYPLQTLLMVAIIPFCIFGMRGGIGREIRPITLSNANLYVNRPIEAAIVLNTPFSILRTFGKKTFVNPNYFSKEELENIYTPVHQAADSLTFKKKNVVIFILESFGKEYFGVFNKELENGNYKGYTSFLDSLAQHCYTFKYSYGNGRKSIDGMPSVLSGIPMFIEPFFLISASNKVSGIAGELGKKGYHSAFFHGAKNGSMGFQAFSHVSGFQEYYGRDEYNDDPNFNGDNDFDGCWAIWDEPFLQFFCNKMSTFQEPFVSTVFTASSHHPFALPEAYRNVYLEEEMVIHKCIRYSDHALKQFFETAIEQPWFSNTIFVFTADHTSMTNHPEYESDLGRFAVPILFYDPTGDLKGNSEVIAQQIDIMPTLLGYLGYDKSYVSFGCDLLSTPPEKTFAVNYLNGIYQYTQGDYLLQFDGEKTTAVYAFKTDPLLKTNLLNTVPQQETMERQLKAIIQQYMERMSKDALTVEEDSK